MKSTVSNFKISGVTCALPNNKLHIDDLPSPFSEREKKRFQKMVGVQSVYHVKNEETTSDLCYEAALNLLKKLDWDIESIDGVIVVTQTPDYFVPSTACVLHGRLGLKKEAIAFDIPLGCSGYVYGLWIASKLLDKSSIKRILLLAGDTSSKTISSEDRSVALLFGDAGTATAIEYDETAEDVPFILGTDGTGYNNLIIPAGAYRKKGSTVTKLKISDEEGNVRSEEQLFMNGAEVFNFTLEEVPNLLLNIIEENNCQIDKVDLFILHQANKLILETIARKCKIPLEKVPINIQEYGNTSSASIPLVISDIFQSKSHENDLHVVLSGFGVGYSWAAASLSLERNLFAETIFI